MKKKLLEEAHKEIVHDEWELVTALNVVGESSAPFDLPDADQEILHQ